MQWLDILKCIEAGESRTVEFKAGFDTAKIGPAACAFANSDGGVVILGVDESGAIVGVTRDPDAVHERLTTFLGSGFNYPMTATCGRNRDPRGWVHWVHVLRQRNREPLRFRDVAWVRGERSSVRPSPSELQELNNQFGFVMTEEQIVSGAAPGDIDEGCFRDFLRRQGLGQRGGRQPDLVDDYRNLNVVRSLDRRPTPTLYGLLAFGRSPQRFPNMRNLLVRNTAYSGSGRATGVWLAADARGRMEEQVETSLNWARSVGRKESYAGFRRSDRQVLPIDALREAIVNAVIHRDYAITGTPITVDVFRDRVEIASPGTLPNGMSLAKVRRGGNARSRNETMAHYAVVTQMMEQRGMGWPMIEDAMQDFNGTTPRIEEDREGAWVRVTLVLEAEDTSVRKS